MCILYTTNCLYCFFTSKYCCIIGVCAILFPLFLSNHKYAFLIHFIDYPYLAFQIPYLLTNHFHLLLLAIAGLEALNRPCNIELYSDSQYLVKAFNEHWIDSWVKKVVFR